MTDFVEQQTANTSKKSRPKHKTRVVIESSGSGASNQLVLRLYPRDGEAKAIIEWCRLKQRHQDDAAAIVRDALRRLRMKAKVTTASGPARKRLGLLQGNIPASWKLRLTHCIEALKAKNEDQDAAGLLRDEIYAWINPDTGARRHVSGKGGDQSQPGAKRYRGPVDYRKYVAPYRKDYTSEMKADKPVRQQVELGKAGKRLKELLDAHEVPHGLFLGTLVVVICARLKRQAEPAVAKDAD